MTRVAPPGGVRNLWVKLKVNEGEQQLVRATHAEHCKVTGQRLSFADWLRLKLGLTEGQES